MVNPFLGQPFAAPFLNESKNSFGAPHLAYLSYLGLDDTYPASRRQQEALALFRELPLRHVRGFPALGLLWGFRDHRCRHP